MNIALFARSVHGDDLRHVQQVVDKLISHRCGILVFRPFHADTYGQVDYHNPWFFEDCRDIRGKADILVSFGGDGTMLEAMTLVRDSGIPVMGINMGRLGFLSSISTSGISSAIDSLLAGDYRLEQRTPIRLTHPAGLFGELNYGLNDLAITRKDSASLMVLKVFIDGLFLSNYWADGLIIATPTGSTAYSLSCGGPILTPDSANFVLTPIAPHNLTVRPIVIPSSSKIRIIAEGRDDQFLVSLDSRKSVVGTGQEMIAEKADFQVNLVQLHRMNFYSTIREKLKWGLDARNW